MTKLYLFRLWHGSFVWFVSVISWILSADSAFYSLLQVIELENSSNKLVQTHLTAKSVLSSRFDPAWKSSPSTPTKGVFNLNLLFVLIISHLLYITRMALVMQVWMKYFGNESRQFGQTAKRVVYIFWLEAGLFWRIPSRQKVSIHLNSLMYVVPLFMPNGVCDAIHTHIVR